ncbi:hypothetical protein O181_018123 [Austropuccinia psidii MF-1]|uniref:Integrase catalytic domain-containing protein n=1 Tax=Austropuccinia psidii MF-1 TaxID=1389203 RepID=A0A9Q3C8G2_9BASI|nr:hypothetical protein [Austropuccinia psidii MF-1]
MFHDGTIFTTLIPNTDERIATSDTASQLRCKGQGSVTIVVNNKPITLYNFLYVPKITRNLVSLLELCTHTITIKRQGPICYLLKDNPSLLSGYIINILMIVSFNQPSSLLTRKILNSRWHLCLGNPGSHIIKSLGLKPHDDNPCNICVKGKMAQLPFKSHFYKNTMPIHFIHMDIVGPIFPPSISGHLYFFTIIDQHTSSKITTFLNTESEVYIEFVIQQKLIENIHYLKIKKIIIDGGGEFINKKSKELANQHGFLHSVTPKYTPKHN